MSRSACMHECDKSSQLLCPPSTTLPALDQQAADEKLLYLVGSQLTVDSQGVTPRFPPLFVLPQHIQHTVSSNIVAACRCLRSTPGHHLGTEHRSMSLTRHMRSLLPRQFYSTQQLPGEVLIVGPAVQPYSLCISTSIVTQQLHSVCPSHPYPANSTAFSNFQVNC